MGPRLAAFVASLLFSRGLAGILCRKYSREAQVFSGSPVDAYLAEISSLERSVHESCCGWESNRLSVAKKLSAGGEAQAELVIRYWV